MVEKIIDGISQVLHETFGEDYDIYTESVEQGLEEPCFSILCLEPSREPLLGRRYFQTNPFCIHFFPSEKEKMAQCNKVREQLFDSLGMITVDGDLTRGTAMKSEIKLTRGGMLKSEIEAGVKLLFFVEYNMFMQTQVEHSPMGGCESAFTVQ